MMWRELFVRPYLVERQQSELAAVRGQAAAGARQTESARAAKELRLKAGPRNTLTPLSPLIPLGPIGFLSLLNTLCPLSPLSPLSSKHKALLEGEGPRAGYGGPAADRDGAQGVAAAVAEARDP